MKQIFVLLIAIGGLFLSGNAQRSTLMPTVAGDTIVNTGTVTKSLPLVTAGYNAIGIQVVVSKISGTVGGTVTPQVSLNGTNWITLPGASALTLTDITTNTQGWSIIGGVPWTHFRLLGAGTGTMSARLQVLYVLRRHD